MRKLFSLTLATLILTICSMALHAEEKTPPAENADKKAADNKDAEENLEAKLARKISCDFVDSPIKDVLAFVQKIVKINIIATPRMLELGGHINLKVADMPLGELLGFVCKLSNSKMEIKEQAVFLSMNDEGSENPGAKNPENSAPVGAKFRLKLGNGNEIETDAAIFNSKPELLEKLVERFLKD